MPSVANDSSVADSGSDFGKKTVPKYNAAAVPKPMKSYVSMTAPTEQPIATRFFSGVPSMGCQCATSCRCGSLMLISSVFARPADQLPTLLAACAAFCHLSDDVVVLLSASRLCTYAPRSATRTRAAPPTCTSGRRPAEISRSMVRSETPSCSAASVLVSSSRPDTVEQSDAARQRVKHWHVLTFPDTGLREMLATPRS